MKTQDATKSAKTKTGRLKAKVLGAYYGHPIKDMKLICITGTAGKTEVANFVHEILKAACQPASENARTIWAPIPRDPPVISTVRTPLRLLFRRPLAAAVRRWIPRNYSIGAGKL